MDGVDAPHSSLFELSAHVGTVLQDPDGQFIGLTVGEDIAFALENSCTPQDEMHAITRHAAELVGIENHLGYAPHELSGGQKQRLSIARAVYRHPEILIFDDSFSALDFKTDRAVRDALEKEAKDSTKLIVAQRIGTIMNADRIIVLDDGKVVGQGTHEELLDTCEVYRQIAESQLSEDELKR